MAVSVQGLTIVYTVNVVRKTRN